MGTDDTAGVRDDMILLEDERAEIIHALNQVVANFSLGVAALDERIVTFTERCAEVRERAELLGEPFTVSRLLRLNGFRREPVATLARFEGRLS
jgi:hypothetical protein